ncbi:hypothetical protein BN7_1592 [Wickerhamomyces ciferrii]|uniref:Uncharacterized protein n=1 Tax=Wickerhamomyces ciferrii (strain ATCC 14091 / BCRC 22168 / CBS 111 / JCM 3599 / NBRC 0793 / NRRL Y-1031 F-60-10) TaxID=1206466 RepID=K0KLQ0_WICCF|nr:uncharacterized protein BN7_1592 [Wickerhamomyces ciferrii]CCH42053.1 hypothetical protein BN7_1592 [Wickerhamomyces ciferrii]
MSTDIKQSLRNANFVRGILINDIKRLESEYFNLNQVQGTKSNIINQKKKFWLENLRPALLRYWKFKRSLFPLIHYSKKHLKSLKEAKEANNKITQKSEHGKTVLGPFPLEIWDMIMKRGGVKREVLRLNRGIFNDLAPYAFGGGGFQNLQLLLVVSSTKKMRQNDACFLREGPDFPDKPCDSFSIYKRDLESSKFEYEFLDVAYDAPKRIRDEKTLVITDYEDIKFLFHHLISNPDSIVKKSFKSIRVDISILHGYKELIYDSDSKVNHALKHYGKSLDIGSFSSMIQAKTDEFFYGTDSHQLFNKGESRWGHPKLGISNNSDAHSFSKVSHNTANEVFPSKVYFNELIHLSELFKSYDSGERNELFKISTKKELRKNHPYQKYVVSPDQFKESPDFDGQQLKMDGAIASHNIKIQKRRFSSANEVKSLIKLMVETLSCDKIFHDTDASLFISGMSDFQETNEIRKKQPGKSKPVLNMFKYKPHLTLLNKPKSV